LRSFLAEGHGEKEAGEESDIEEEIWEEGYACCEAHADQVRRSRL
jgi:hypothetical protein